QRHSIESSCLIDVDEGQPVGPFLLRLMEDIQYGLEHLVAPLLTDRTLRTGESIARPNRSRSVVPGNDPEMLCLRANGHHENGTKCQPMEPNHGCTWGSLMRKISQGKIEQAIFHLTERIQ